jgi:hypothetical protein
MRISRSLPGVKKKNYGLTLEPQLKDFMMEVNPAASIAGG